MPTKMKSFKFMGLDFECQDKYKYAAMDKDGTFWVFVEKPSPTNMDWDSYYENMQVFPIIQDMDHIPWDESLVEI